MGTAVDLDDVHELIGAVEHWLIDERAWPTPVEFPAHIDAGGKPVSVPAPLPLPLPAPRAAPTVTVAAALRAAPQEMDEPFPWLRFTVVAVAFGLTVILGLAGAWSNWPWYTLLVFLAMTGVTFAIVLATLFLDTARAEAEGSPYGLCSPSRAANITGRNA